MKKDISKSCHDCLPREELTQTALEIETEGIIEKNNKKLKVVGETILRCSGKDPNYQICHAVLEVYAARHQNPVYL